MGGQIHRLHPWHGLGQVTHVLAQASPALEGGAVRQVAPADLHLQGSWGAAERHRPVEQQLLNTCVSSLQTAGRSMHSGRPTLTMAPVVPASTMFPAAPSTWDSSRPSLVRARPESKQWAACTAGAAPGRCDEAR